MTFVLFYHSLLSDWNHGNAHFLRGVVTELQARGHRVKVYEPREAWSLQGLRAETRGEEALHGFRSAYPGLDSVRYDPARLDLDEALDGADLVIVHEWSDHELVRRIGAHRARSSRYRLLFHDTHHRSVTESQAMAAYDLRHYDGVLAFGRVIKELYLERGWAQRAWTWHEAADTRLFRPIYGLAPEGDLAWIGNWGDEERTAELHEFLLQPVKTLGLRARVHGVRYPKHALAALEEAGIEYGGWLPNHQAPELFAHYPVTVHVPRRPYRDALPGIPTIRVFEALACGIPLVSAPWDDVEGLFTPGQDFLVARSGKEMARHLWTLLNDRELRCELALHGRRTILGRHTCRHRVDELLAIAASLRPALPRLPAGRHAAGDRSAAKPATAGAWDRERGTPACRSADASVHGEGPAAFSHADWRLHSGNSARTAASALASGNENGSARQVKESLATRAGKALPYGLCLASLALTLTDRRERAAAVETEGNRSVLPEPSPARAGVSPDGTEKQP